MKKTSTASIQYSSPPKKSSETFKRQSCVSNQCVEELPNSVVLGQIFLSWKTLQPSSQGIRGFLQDIKNIHSHESKEEKNENQYCYGISATTSQKNSQNLTLQKPCLCDPESFLNGKHKSGIRTRNNHLTNNDSLRTNSMTEHRRQSANFRPNPELNKDTTLNKNTGSRDPPFFLFKSACALDKDLLSKETSTGMTYLGFPKTTGQSNSSSDSDALEPLLKSNELSYYKNHTSLWTLYTSKLKSVLDKTFNIFSYIPHASSWREVFRNVWKDCFQLLNFSLLYKNLAKLKKQQILRNITRRSHPVCALLFFPVYTDVNFLKKHSTNYFSRIKKKKKAAFLFKIKTFQFSHIHKTRKTPSKSNHQQKNIQSVFFLKKKKHQDNNNNLLFDKPSRLDSFRLNCLRKNHALLRRKKNKCYQRSQTHGLSRSLESSKSTISDNTLLCGNTRLSHVIKRKKKRTDSSISRIVSSIKKNTASETQQSDSNYSYTTMKYDRFDINSSFIHPQHSVPKIKKTLANIKKPRVLMYGGAINDSLEGCRGVACDCLSEFSLYTLILDEKERLRGSKPCKTLMYNELSQGDVNVDSGSVFLSDENEISTLKDSSSTYSEKSTSVQNRNQHSTDTHQYIFQLNSTIFKMNSRNTDGFQKRSFGYKSSSADTNTMPWLKYQPHQVTVNTSYTKTVDESTLQWNENLSYKTRSTSLDAVCHLPSNHETPSARFGSSSVSYKGRLYLFGGGKVSEWKRFTLMNDFWVLSVGAPNNSRRIGLNLPPYGNEKLIETGYIWRQVPLNTSLRPPPCAFHLACVNNGFMYLLISECSVADELQDVGQYFENIAYDGTKFSDQRLLLEAELMSSRNKCINATVLNAYMKQLKKNKSSLNQIWRINLDVRTPQWELFPVTISKCMTQMVKGGIALTVYCNRIYVYGAFNKQSHVAIGVLDIHLKMWVTSVKLAGAPVWVTAVAIGKLWLLLGVESWGIFNMETFEWRYSNAPPEAPIRYGCRSLWLPPYLPSQYNDPISANAKVLNGLHKNITKYLLKPDLPSQYLSLLLQSRRPMDNVHTLLLFGGFNSDGQLSNQVDQVLVFLPPELSVNCFLPMRQEENSFYASLFDVNTLHGETFRANGEIRDTTKTIKKEKTFDERHTALQRLRQSLDECHASVLKREKVFQVILRDMELRLYFEQQKLKRQLSNKERIIDRLQLQLKKKKLIYKKFLI